MVEKLRNMWNVCMLLDTTNQIGHQGPLLVVIVITLVRLIHFNCWDGNRNYGDNYYAHIWIVDEG